MGRTTRSKSSVLVDKTNITRKIADAAPKKLCVYQLQDTAECTKEAKEDNDVFEFEFDSSEEPRVKAKKRRVNKGKSQKTTVKRLKAPAKSGPKGKKTQKKKSPPKTAKTAPLIPKPLIQNAVVRPAELPHRSIFSNIPSNFQAHVPAALRKNPQTIKSAYVINSLPSTPIANDVSIDSVPPSPVTSYVSPVTVPLENLFDDDVEIDIPHQKPTRFEYSELAEARARVIRTSLTPGIAVPNPRPQRESTPEPPKMKQTSILNFVQAAQEEEEGLFSSSTPFSPIVCSMFSPVREENPANTTDMDVHECDQEEEEAEVEAEEVVEDEDLEDLAPTRLSLRTLKHAIEANKKDLIMPVSPKRTFSRPARKSYEKRSKKRALDFLEIESDEESDLDLEAHESENEEFEKTKKKAHKHKPNKKEKMNSKAFEDWAQKFNKDLEEYEGYSLSVE